MMKNDEKIITSQVLHEEMEKELGKHVPKINARGSGASTMARKDKSYSSVFDFFKKIFSKSLMLLLILSLVFCFVGCGPSDSEIGGSTNNSVNLESDAASQNDADGSEGQGDIGESGKNNADASAYELKYEIFDDGVLDSLDEVEKDKAYSSKEDVAAYLIVFGVLPSNFITKDQADDLGWSGGGLDDYEYGKCIGGDRFRNREGYLPSGDDIEYTECDIDTLHKDSRGAKRIVFSNEGMIYYTKDHYDSFTVLYGEPLN